MVFLFAQRRTRYKGLSIVLILSLAILFLLLIYQNAKLQDVLITATSPLFKVSIPQHPKTYNDSTLPIFPPIIESPDGGQSDLCSNFPQQWLERVQVVLKTGVGQSEKNEAHLTSVTSCIRNLIVFSDIAERRGSHDFLDILAGLPAPYLENPDFSAYHKQQNAYESGGKIESSTDGWKLDRFKFLPMVNAAHDMRPNASWYVFLEADVYIFWDNLFRLLDQFNAQDSHYFGSAAPGSHGRWFAYGGAGIVLSEGLMKSLVEDGTKLSEKYQEWTLDDCCGDAVLGYVILDKTGVKLKDLYPMFSGDYLEDLGISKQRWCNPLISLHRMSVDSLRSLWLWERTRRAQEVDYLVRLRSRLTVRQRPLVYSDILEYRQSYLQNTSSRDFWDNLSADVFHNASYSFSACAEACEKNKTCLQYSYTTNECRLWPYIVHGHEVSNKDVEFTSGWNRERISQLGLNSSGCETGKWTRPVIHRCGLINCA